MKKKYSEDFYLKRFQEVVIFLTAVNIKKHFSSLEAYQRVPNKNKAYHLNIKWDILRKLSRIGNHKHFKAFCRKSQSLFIYHEDYHHKYPSGKRFNRNAWFELSDKVLEDYFSTPANFNTKTCHFLSKEAHKFIDKHVYKFDTIQKPKKDKKDMKDPDAEKLAEMNSKQVEKRIAKLQKQATPEVHEEPAKQEAQKKQAYLTREKMQTLVYKRILSKRQASLIWQLLSGHREEFKEERHGWCLEDSYCNKDNRKKIFKHIFDNIEHYNIDIASLTALNASMCR